MFNNVLITLQKYNKKQYGENKFQKVINRDINIIII